MKRETLLDLLLLLAVVVAALTLRAWFPYGSVVVDGRVVFTGNDPWIHMRNADNVAAHLPWPSWFDPYRLAPGGQWSDAPLLPVTIASFAALFSLGTPTPAILDLSGAWLPAIAGSLIPIPIFFLVRRLFGRNEAIVAAILVAIFPGELLSRSLFGRPDHHVLEALLAVCVLFFMVRAVESDERKSQAKESAIAGAFLGLYLLTWARGAFLVLILVAWALIEIRERTRIAPVVAICFGVALLFSAPAAIHLEPMSLTIPVLAGGALAVIVAQRIPSKWLIPFALTVAALLVIAIPDLLRQAARFLPAGGAATVSEIQPLLLTQGRFSLRPLWWELTTSAILAPVGFVLSLRRTTPARRLILIWSGLVTMAALAQGRFAYYLAVAAAIFAAVAAVRLFQRDAGKAFAAVIIAAIVIYPNLPAAVRAARTPLPRPTSGWLAALDWMRENTPEPFGSPSTYFSRYTPRTAPRAEYSVMAWWDYGWWVTRIARRPPATNPTQTAVREAALFYTATTEAEALEILESRGSSYVIVDRSMPMTIAGAGRVMSSQLEPIARWAEKDPSIFYELVFADGRPLFIYHPPYYRTMAIRLFGYDGRGWTPSDSTWAVVIDEKRNLVASRRFATYEEAQNFVAREGGRWRLVGLDPIRSSVPLEPLERFSLEFASPPHDVKIFRIGRSAD